MQMIVMDELVDRIRYVMYVHSLLRLCPADEKFVDVGLNLTMVMLFEHYRRSIVRKSIYSIDFDVRARIQFHLLTILEVVLLSKVKSNKQKQRD